MWGTIYGHASWFRGVKVYKLSLSTFTIKICRLQSRNSELEIKLQSSKEELVRLKAEYGNVVKAHHNAKTVRETM